MKIITLIFILLMALCSCKNTELKQNDNVDNIKMMYQNVVTKIQNTPLVDQGENNEIDMGMSTDYWYKSIIENIKQNHIVELNIDLEGILLGGRYTFGNIKERFGNPSLYESSYDDSIDGIREFIVYKDPLNDSVNFTFMLFDGYLYRWTVNSFENIKILDGTISVGDDSEKIINLFKEKKSNILSRLIRYL